MSDEDGISDGSDIDSNLEETVLGSDDSTMGFQLSREDSNQLTSNEIAGFTYLRSVVNTYNAFMYTNPAELDDYGKIRLSILSEYLPLSSQVVYGFADCSTLLQLEIGLSNFSFTHKPDTINYFHPVLGKTYVGRPIVNEVIAEFFSTLYKPRSFYKSAAYLLSPPGKCDMKLLKKLRDEGYDGDRAEHALTLYNNDYMKALDFLKTGQLPVAKTDIAIPYSDCPLLYLVLEIVEVFLDLPDHCCICRKLSTDTGVKPMPCDDQLCNYTYVELGVGCSLYNEIKRDPLAADLVFSMFCCSIGTPYMKPAPTMFNQPQMIELIEKIPRMSEIIANYKSDSELEKSIGTDAFTLLRWVLMTNRSQFISLDDELTLPEYLSQDTKIFMVIANTPQKENDFRELRSKYNSLWFWHGSLHNRWHSIFRNGLQNMSNTPGMANAACYGPGIYLARNSGDSLGYVREGKNRYTRSAFGTNLNLIALCEVANVPDLADNGWNHTLRDTKAVVIRFLIFNMKKSIDVIKDPPKNIPTLRDVLEHHANNARK
ncbi:hypothetical protein TVAG_117520 [Trichomonas vaginalis G3]|uniref:UBA domain-containing protein n=1 Tax=Trichomonas vaginalis (strain ATCC PRA-98 / G3) TaxID=412133 RepID=A2E3U2_TRIV3|nr:poly ADP-ribose polymerase family, member PARP family [Trichomonas vaginalis G3]EAY12730.1 hypothetical protein TVAG_117520 [Trichomonas vaginalis G3]KAI5517508.1 poly ADP-ribose polymerase family, member PARP family [Trichomonas vaginalis G3]|eukprot:XP_001324953.1 hypothetical protein [Trichomonas vaginalis G3]